jgi:hypothetical protein
VDAAGRSGNVRLVSEYQYYEFLALDRPLTDKQRAELRSISTRAEITATRFVNEYQWGDLRGDPRKMVERYASTRQACLTSREPVEGLQFSAHHLAG